MGAIASQITSITIVYSTVYSDTDQRKHQSSASLAFVRGIHRGPVNSPHKWPVTRKIFPFDDVIMKSLLWPVCDTAQLEPICCWWTSHSRVVMTLATAVGAKRFLWDFITNCIITSFITNFSTAYKFSWINEFLNTVSHMTAILTQCVNNVFERGHQASYPGWIWGCCQSEVLCGPRACQLCPIPTGSYCRETQTYNRSGRRSRNHILT